MFHVYELEAQGFVNYVIDAKPYRCKATQINSHTTKEEALVWRDTKARMCGGLWYRRSPCWCIYLDHARTYQWEIARDMGISIKTINHKLRRARAWLHPWPEHLEEWIENRKIQQPKFHGGYVI